MKPRLIFSNRVIIVQSSIYKKFLTPNKRLYSTKMEEDKRAEEITWKEF